MAKNLQSLQLLRNGSLYQTKAAAKTALESFITEHSTMGDLDGVAILARYNSDAGVKTLLGLAYSGGTQTVTVFDADVSDILANLDASTVSGASKVVIDVTQADGQITATAENLSGVKLDGLTAGTDSKIAATDTLGEALANIQAQIDAMDLTTVSGSGEVITAVGEQDGKVTAEKTALTDIVLTGFVEDSGKTGNIADTDTVEDAINKLQNTIQAAQNAVSVNNTDGSINVATAVTGTSIDVNIKSGEHVLAKDGGNGLYTDISLSSVTPSSTTVKEEFKLFATDGTQLGDTIKIYKDSSIVSINLVDQDDSGHTGQFLEYTYINASGGTEDVYVDVSLLLVEAEFASGVTANNAGIVHGVVDPTSEGYLTVGANGFKVSGIDDAIGNAVSGLDADVSGNSAHVTVGVEEVDGKITAVTVAESDIANATDLEALSGKAVTTVAMTGGTITTGAAADGTVSVEIDTDGSQIELTNYTKGSDSGAVAATDTVNAAISKLENQIDAAAAGASDGLDELSGKAVTEIESSDNSISAVSSATADGTVKYNVTTDGAKVKLTGYDNTVTGDVAATDSVNDAISKVENKVDDAQEEINAIETAVGLAADGTYVADTANTYTSGAQSVADAIDALDDSLKALSDIVEDLGDNAISAITVNGSGVTVTNNVAALSVTSATGATTATGNEAITVETGSNGEITLGLATLDCGYFDQ